MLTELSIVLLVVGLFILAYFMLPTKNTSIIDNAVPGTHKVQSDQLESTKFSYTCWIRIDKFDYGVPKVIFVKGSPDLEHACPALILDGNANTLMVKLDTFGAQETIPITNVSAKKWLHIGLTVEEHSLKVYVNGIQYADHILTNLPKPNQSRVLTSPQGFSGSIANLQFYSRTLEPEEILKLSQTNPSTSESNQVFPPYLSPTWFRS